MNIAPVSPHAGMLRRIPALVLVAVLAGAVVLLPFTAYRTMRWIERHLPSAPANPARQVFALLRSQDLGFLVTERMTSQVSIEIDESDLWRGCRTGTLTGIVKLYYGVDLCLLEPGDVRMEGGACTVTLPAPGVLDFAVDVESLVFRTRRSLLNVLGDRWEDRDLRQDLQRRFRAASETFFHDHHLLPDRAALCARLNAHASAWAARVGLPVAFE